MRKNALLYATLLTMLCGVKSLCQNRPPTESELRIAYEKVINGEMCESDLKAANDLIAQLGSMIAELKAKVSTYVIKTRENESMLADLNAQLNNEKGKSAKDTRYYRLTGGLETGYLAGELLPKVNLGYQNAKGYTFKAGYDLDKRIWIGAEIPLITIKR